MNTYFRIIIILIKVPKQNDTRFDKNKLTSNNKYKKEYNIKSKIIPTITEKKYFIITNLSKILFITDNI